MRTNCRTLLQSNQQNCFLLPELWWCFRCWSGVVLDKNGWRSGGGTIPRRVMFIIVWSTRHSRRRQKTLLESFVLSSLFRFVTMLSRAVFLLMLALPSLSMGAKFSNKRMLTSVWKRMWLPPILATIATIYPSHSFAVEDQNIEAVKNVARVKNSLKYINSDIEVWQHENFSTKKHFPNGRHFNLEWCRCTDDRQQYQKSS